MSASCRFCDAPLTHTVCDLGMSPLSNAYLSKLQLNQMEATFPLHAYVCAQCFLVQLQSYESPDIIFSDYAYFSSYSVSWLQHAADYVDLMCKKMDFTNESLVVEIASNDGYLLKNFVEKNIPVLGIEPAANIAEVAREAGVNTRVEFFGQTCAQTCVSEGRKANLLLGNNVLAHVPDINDFVAGMRVLLADSGVITMEFPHLLSLMQYNQFDTIYHEHFSYLSFGTVQAIFAAHQLTLFDVELLPTHGGSLRIYGCHQANTSFKKTSAVDNLLYKEQEFGLQDIDTYLKFSDQVKKVKRQLLIFLIMAKESNKQVVGYGAPAKGNTLLNYAGVREDLIDYTVDLSPYKQDKFLPGTHIPIYSPDQVKQTKPDYVLILPWNLKDEITHQMAYIRDWGGQFVVPIPELMVLP